MILHYAGIWLFIGEPAPKNKNCYSISISDWYVLRHMHPPVIKLLVAVKEKFSFEISKT